MGNKQNGKQTKTYIVSGNPETTHLPGKKIGDGASKYGYDCAGLRNDLLNRSHGAHVLAESLVQQLYFFVLSRLDSGERQF
jgi:hypothetical protein